MKKKIGMFLGVLFLMNVSLFAGEISFFGKTDKNPLNYKPGEKIVFTVQTLEDGKPVAGKELLWTREGDDGITENGTAISSDKEPLTITTKLEIAGFVHLIVRVKGLQGKDNQKFNGGAGVLIYAIGKTVEPADFDAYWDAQKAALAKVPVRASLKKLESANPKFEVYDVVVDCLGKPVRGIMCKPVGAKAKSLPAYVFYHGYGVNSSSRRMIPNALSFDVNANSVLNEQPKEYYENLKKTTLKGYGFSVEENSKRETSYWNGVLLRVMRALDYIKQQPEWNGRDLSVSGGSQGGFQSLSAAGLDSDVSFCSAAVPWMCDISGKEENGRVGSLFRPKWTPALGYFDTANHARRIKCRTNISAGLGDYVCPPSGVMVLFNQIGAPKKLTFNQGQTHGYHMPNAQSFVLNKGM
ncbi:MAG: acetylxylan esterase [Planctomycetia bacterium]|nr:acetylxylan esterase [Planctomycetia bacterium]